MVTRHARNGPAFGVEARPPARPAASRTSLHVG